ncbi:diacylglycerol/lipid kinase family protein [Croceicoccus naphthovorans]|uniref:Uncharacterized protein n=1 Tax=Croceicoccus naphthovorans TaxID=1348774 RepID=A0A0G3XKU8_9SPHN|nr:diacylglycerol kinase family protein [Croceicoccus naphthovorans]AKM11226.1 hypothetical protein AB433_16605 [Croceicoccus naphthovorans]MBB3989871.1 diacylglycerol kinase family enzyme [Croceicoccus naphthovorans]
MKPPTKTWLIVNPDSGSYDEKAFDALTQCCGDNDLTLDRVIQFPKDDLPTAAELDAAGIEMVTIYTGDGTINALVTQLYGWGGSILILPGGTMNLLAHRLHGYVDVDHIVARLSRGTVRRERPHVVRCDAGDALAGLMVGPGTAWNTVREAMRHGDIVGIAGGAAEAIGQSTSGSMVKLVEPVSADAEGYPLILMNPEPGTIRVEAYHAETVGEYAQQGVALLKRDFREGPHDDLGQFTDMTLASEDGSPLQALVDGEPADLPPRARFSIVPCEVDLIVSADA